MKRTPSLSRILFTLAVAATPAWSMGAQQLFEAAVRSSIGGTHVIDLDGDGDLDLVGDYTSANDGNGTFTVAGNVHVYGTGLVPADFDLNGRLDYLGLKPHWFAIAFVETDGTYIVPSGSDEIEVALETEAAVIADFNCDSYPDVMLSHPDSDKVSIYINNRARSLSRQFLLDTGDKPGPMAVCDLYADENPDVFVLNRNDSTISIFTSFLNGQFIGRRDLSTLAGATTFTTADVDADVDLDVVVANGDAGIVSVQLNDGTGNFTPPILLEDNVAGEINSVLVGDLDGDAFPDLVLDASVGELSEFRTRKNLGDTTFAASIRYPAGGAVALGDFNGDAALDIVAGGRYYRNHGDGTFPRQDTFDCPMDKWQVVSSDFDNDGDKDFAVSGRNASTHLGEIQVFFNEGDGSFGAPLVLESPIQAIPITESWSVEYKESDTLTAPDLDGDGLHELALTQPAGGVVMLFRNQGGGSFAPAQSIEVGTPEEQVSSCAFGNLDGDLLPDLAVAGLKVVKVFHGKPDGAFEYAMTFQSEDGLHPSGIAIADFNRDGWNDIVSAHIFLRSFNGMSGPPVELALRYNSGNGELSFPTTELDEIGYYEFTLFTFAGINAVDINIDGYTDLVSSTGSVVFNGVNGLGLCYWNFQNVGLGDVNGDGLLDFASSYYNSIRVQYTNGGGMPLPTQQSYGVTGFNDLSVVADFDGDTFADILAVENGTGPIHLLRSTGPTQPRMGWMISGK